MVQYNPEIIEEYAAQLYRRAQGMVVGLTVVFAFGGVFLGWILERIGNGNVVFTAILAAFLGSIGWQTGVRHAFVLKLQAQQALCQLQIERNTRPEGVKEPTSGGVRPANWLRPR